MNLADLSDKAAKKKNNKTQAERNKGGNWRSQNRAKRLEGEARAGIA